MEGNHATQQQCGADWIRPARPCGREVNVVLISFDEPSIFDTPNLIWQFNKKPHIMKSQLNNFLKSLPESYFLNVFGVAFFYHRLIPNFYRIRFPWAYSDRLSHEMVVCEVRKSRSNQHPPESHRCLESCEDFVTDPSFYPRWQVFFVPGFLTG